MGRVVCSSSIGCNRMMSLSPPPPIHHHHRRKSASSLLMTSNNGVQHQEHRPRTSLTLCAASKSTGFSLNSIFKKCETCGGQGAIECPGCKGTGKNKKNGNIFERWKCYDCQGFGLKGCPTCGKGGLTPEQRGER